MQFAPFPMMVTLGAQFGSISSTRGFPMAYSTIQEEGSNLTQRSTLNFIGDAVTAADNSGSARTDVTVAAVKLQASSPGTAQTGNFNIDTGVGRLAIQDKGGQVFNVKAYGAKGDGTTDDTTAISAAIAAAGAASPQRGAVYFPHGSYKTTGNFDLSGLDGLTIRGAGIRSTTIQLSHASNDLFKYGSGSTPENLVDLDISDFSVTVATGVTRTGGWVIRGLASANPTGGKGYLRRSRIERLDIKKQVNGIWLNRFETVWVTDVLMTNFVGTSGVGLKAGQTVATPDVNQGSDLRLTNVAIYGLDFVGSDPIALSIGYWVEDCEAVVITSSGALGTLDHGMKMVAGGHGLFNHLFNQFSADLTKNGHGLYITGSGAAARIHLGDCWFASSGGLPQGASSANGVRVDVTGAGHIEFTGCRFLANKGSGLYIVNPTEAPCAVTGCDFDNNGGGGLSGNNHAIYVDVGSGSMNSGYYGPTIVGNVFRANVGACLRTSATSKRVTFSGNEIDNPAIWGIDPDVNAANDYEGGRCHALVYRSTAQSITDSSDTVVLFDSEVIDTTGMHLGTNAGRLTIPPSGSGNAFRGTWILSAGIEFAAHASGLRQIQFLKNGTTVLAYDNRVTVGGAIPTRCTLTAQADLVESDYVEVRAYQNSGNPGGLSTGSGQQSVWFSAVKTH